MVVVIVVKSGISRSFHRSSTRSDHIIRSCCARCCISLESLLQRLLHHPPGSHRYSYKYGLLFTVLFPPPLALPNTGTLPRFSRRHLSSIHLDPRDLRTFADSWIRDIGINYHGCGGANIEKQLYLSLQRPGFHCKLQRTSAGLGHSRSHSH